MREKKKFCTKKTKPKQTQNIKNTITKIVEELKYVFSVFKNMCKKKIEICPGWFTRPVDYSHALDHFAITVRINCKSL